MAQEIGPKEAKALLESGRAVALDVREKEEIEFASIGKHIWIPIHELRERHTELPKGREIICVCRSGHRSAGAAEFLSSKGYSAKNLTGGILGWHREVDRAVRPYVYSVAGDRIEIREITA